MGQAEVLEIINSEDVDVEDCFVKGYCALDERDEEEAPVPVKVDSSANGLQDRAREIKAAFFNAKSLAEVGNLAKGMHFSVWLDYFVKMCPKEVQVKGQMDVRTLVAQLGPISK